MLATTLALLGLSVEGLIAFAIAAFVFGVLAAWGMARQRNPFELRCGLFSLRWGSARDDTS
jgi:hypothetical protein